MIVEEDLATRGRRKRMGTLSVTSALWASPAIDASEAQGHGAWVQCIRTRRALGEAR